MRVSRLAGQKGNSRRGSRSRFCSSHNPYHTRLRLEPLEDRRLLSVATGSELGTSDLGKTTKEWTVMVYLDGDNNLEDAAIDDFLEMASVGTDANVNIVVQMDRISGYATSYDDWTDTRRGLISPGDTPGSSWGTSIGEANMGDPTTLVDFVDWSMANYAANHYALILWDHGGGWRSAGGAGSDAYKGACWDDTNGEDYLENREVGAALASISENMDLFGYDCCLMAMLECAHEVTGEASVFVASEESEPNDGWPYDTFLANLQSNPTWTAAELGADIVVEYGISYSGDYTLSAVDLNAIGDAYPDGLSAAVSNLAGTIVSDANGTDYERLQTHRDNAAYFSDYDFRDLGTFLDGVADDTNLTTSISLAAATARDAYNEAVLQNHSGPANGATGVAIYFPAAGVTPDSDYNNAVLSLADDTLWDEFLDWWAAPSWPGPDLTGTGFEVEPHSLLGSTTTSVTFEITNLGTVSATTGSFAVEFFFSDDADFDNGDEIPANLDISDPHYNSTNPNAYSVAGLSAGEDLSDTITLVVPIADPFATDGQYYLGMRIDEANSVNEYNETNNHSLGSGLDAVAVNWLSEFYVADMDTDPGWSYDGLWAWGTPTGSSSSYGGADPDSGYTGSNVVGYNLSGDYPNDISTPHYATTQAIDCSGYENVTLSFWRWLGIESFVFDHASIEVSNNGSDWTTVWEHAGDTFHETDWSLCAYDISTVADDQPTVYIRWAMGTTDESVHYCGWNLDDVALAGKPMGPDEIGARVVAQSPSVPVSPGQSTLELKFSETMDTSSFNIVDDVVSFTGPSGDLSSQITGYTWLDNRTLRIEFTSQTTIGAYTLVLGPNVLDDAPSLNPMDQNNNGINGQTPDDCYMAVFEIANLSITTLTNPATITIPDVGAASLYPSTIAVSGMSGTLIDVDVTISGLTHTYPDDLDVLLVSPDGQKVMLLSDVGGGNNANGLTLTLDDEAASSLPDDNSLTSGSFQPTNMGDTDTFALPAPLGPYESTLATFDEIDPNGSWTLYVYDDAGGDSGEITAGWSLTITMMADTPLLPGDANLSGTVDQADAAIVAENWGARYQLLPGDANRNGLVNEVDAIIVSNHMGMTGMGWADGDFNDDGQVDVTDASILAANWGATSGPVTWSDGDFNDDGIVDATDASIMAANWGAHAETEPEPVDPVDVVRDAPLIGPLPASQSVATRQAIKPVAWKENFGALLTRSFTSESSPKMTEAACDVVLAKNEAFQPQLAKQPTVDQSSMAWSYTMARRNRATQENDRLRINPLAVELLFAND